MTRGGARNRSGPQPDPTSGRSERRNFKLTALPSEGYTGEAPTFPLGKSLSGETSERELEIWAEAWRTPQACAWSMQTWRWPVLAEYCRLKAYVELAPAATAALVGQIHRYRDQLGLTPAGLKENGWAIAADEVASKRDDKASESRPQKTTPQRRLRAVSGG